MNQPQLEKRIQDLLEGSLEPSALDDLQRELLENDESGEIYREYVSLHNALQVRSEGVDLTGVVPMDRVAQRRQQRILKYSGMASAAILLLTAMVLALIMVKSTPLVSFKTSPGSEYELTALDGQELTGEKELEVGSRLQVRRGTVELKFASGVRGIVRGPADLTLEREDLLNMARGTGWFDVPDEAVGFKVSTPDLILTDLGTEFGILSQPYFLDEAHVFSGKVQVLNLVGLKDQRLITEGEAWVAGPAGHWSETPLRHEVFLKKLPTKQPDEGTVLFEDAFQSNSSSNYVCVDYDKWKQLGSKAFAINSKSNGVLEIKPDRAAQVVHRKATLGVGECFKSDWLTQVIAQQERQYGPSASQVLTNDPGGQRYVIRFRVDEGVFAIDFNRGFEGTFKWFNNAPYTAPETFWIERISETDFAWYRGPTRQELIKIAEVSLDANPGKLFVGLQAYQNPFRFDNLTVIELEKSIHTGAKPEIGE